MTIDARSRRKSLTCTMTGGSTGIAQSTKKIHGRSALSYKLAVTILLKKNPWAAGWETIAYICVFTKVFFLLTVCHVTASRVIFLEASPISQKALIPLYNLLFHGTCHCVFSCGGGRPFFVLGSINHFSFQSDICMARPVEPRYPRILGCLIIGEGLQWDFIHALRAGSVVVEV